MAYKYTYAKNFELTKVGTAITMKGYGDGVLVFYLGAVKSNVGKIRHIFALHPSEIKTIEEKSTFMTFNHPVSWNETKVNAYECAKQEYPAIFKVTEDLKMPIHAPDNWSVKIKSFDGLPYTEFVTPFKKLEEILYILEREIQYGV